MAGGLGGLGGFGNILGAIGQSLLTSPRENPFQGLPQALRSMNRLSEDAASRNAMALVAEKLGVPREIAANPQAMALFIQQLNTQKTNELTNQYLNQPSSLVPPGSDAQPGLSVPGRSSGLDGPGGLGGAGGQPVASAGPRLPTFAAIEGGTPTGKIAGVISRAADRYGVDPTALVRTAQIESSLNPNAKNPSSSAGGLFQFINSTAKQYGLTNKFDPVASADAGARLMRDNADKLRRVLGRDPQPWELYLAHQQGSGGAAKLLANPTASAASLVGADSVRLNGGSPGMTAAQFAGIWRKKFGDLPSASRNATGLLAAASGTTPDFARADAQRLATGRTLGGTATAGAVPLPPPRPIQLASADPNNLPLPSSAMQRVIDEARSKGIGQTGDEPFPGQSTPAVNQAAQRGAPFQVAASTKSTVPLPTMTMPGAPSTPTQAPPQPQAAPGGASGAAAGQNINATRAWAEQNFSLSLKRIALAEQAGLKGVVEAEKAKLPLYTKWLEPSDAARRVAEAGLTGTPLGRAVTAGLDTTIQQSLAEQQIPGYRSPGSRDEDRLQIERQRFGLEGRRFGLETQKYGSEEQQRAFQRNLDERKFGLEGLRFLSTEDQQKYLRNLDERKFGLEGQRFENTKEQQAVQNQRAEAALRQQRDLAEKGLAIRQQSPQEQIGAALNTEARAPNVRAGLDAEAARIATETTARGTATALTREAEAATNAGRMAARLMPALTQAREAFNQLKEGGTGQFGGIGPSANSPTSRAIAARLPAWSTAFKNEAVRQTFDSAMAAIRSAKTAVDLKGQGPVSNFERTLAGADLPDPAAVSADVVDQAFKRLERQLNAALELDNAVGLHGGQQPGARGREGASAAPAMSSSDVAQSLSNARAAIQAGRPRAAVIERLRAAGIDPGGL